MKIKAIAPFKGHWAKIVGAACLLSSLLWCPACAQTAVKDEVATETGIVMKDIFREMPDSLMPYLSHNNRLDLIDFFDSGMKAEVTNEFDGHSQLTMLTADSLSLQLSAALRVDMLLLKSEGLPADSATHVVCVLSTYGVDPVARQTVVRYYSPRWQPYTVANAPISPVDRRRVEQICK